MEENQLKTNINIMQARKMTKIQEAIHTAIVRNNTIHDHDLEIVKSKK
jgi:hypothetical protein